MMAEIQITKDVFFWCISAIYLVAFASLFVQIPGLYGKDGILPAELVLLEEPNSLESFHRQPSLLRFASRCGIDVETGMELLCLAGIVLSFISSIRRTWRNSLTYLALWFFYLSLFHVGQTFLYFQWDILLLETGLLTVLVAPLGWSRLSGWFNAHDKIAFWPVRWLLFRLLFASGVVKLTSRCPAWWGLTALTYHYESQCIPTPLAWYLYQASLWFQKLCLVITFIFQLLVPFLFFSPVLSHRKWAFYSQALLMFTIILSGNYYFFNWLTIVLCLSLIDDNQINRWITGKSSAEKSQLKMIGRWMSHVLVVGCLIFSVVHLFSLHLNLNLSSPLEASFAIDVETLEHYLVYVVPLTVVIAAVSLLFHIVSGLIRSFKDEKETLKKLSNAIGCIVIGLVVVFIFCISLVPYTRIEKNTQDRLPMQFKQWNHLTASSFRLTNSYGLFKRMTGVGGRPEVVIEGSNSENGGWKEYEFRYKPGNVNRRLPVVAPHHPRLDWQMWFAALSKYQRHPWFLNLIYRLLQNQPKVLMLMEKNPFQEVPPQYIQATLYHYHFTSSNESSERFSRENWWTREKVRQYLPPMSLSHPILVGHVKRNLAQTEEKLENLKSAMYVRLATKFLQSWLSGFDGFTLCVALVASSLVIISIHPILKHLQESI